MPKVRCLKTGLVSRVRIKDLDKVNLIKLAYGGKVLGSSTFPRLLQLPQKMTLTSKVVKIGPKIINSLLQSKSVKYSENFELSEPELINWGAIHHPIDQNEISPDRRQTQRSVFRLGRRSELVELFVRLRRLDDDGLRNPFVEIGQIGHRNVVDSVWRNSEKISNLFLHDRRNVSDVWVRINLKCPTCKLQRFS